MRQDFIYCGQPASGACDRKCNKAWGVNGRPEISFDDNDENDTAYLSDDELGDAPIDPGTYEGGHAKPERPPHVFNKWCVRECERISWGRPGELIVLRDFSKRVYNQPWKHPEAVPACMDGI